MLKNRVGFAASSCHFVDTIVLFTIYQIYICIKMAFFWSDRILAKVDAERKKYIKNTSRNRFEIRDLFLLVEQNRALYFFRPSKIQGKIQLLMVPYNRGDDILVKFTNKYPGIGFAHRSSPQGYYSIRLEI